MRLLPIQIKLGRRLLPLLQFIGGAKPIGREYRTKAYKLPWPPLWWRMTACCSRSDSARPIRLHREATPQTMSLDLFLSEEDKPEVFFQAIRKNQRQSKALNDLKQIIPSIIFQGDFDPKAMELTVLGSTQFG